MDFRVVVIGAGIVGLSVAAKLAERFENVLIIDKNNKFGQETSSRNSEVIHSGVYYPHYSLKSMLCVAGRKKLYSYCRQKGITFNKCGKYIVASNPEELVSLRTILTNAERNGVDNACLISKAELRNREPNVRASGAVFFAETGVVSSFELMKSLETSILNKNGQIVYSTELINMQKTSGGYRLFVKDGHSDFSFTSEIVVNSAGLYADTISAMLGITDYPIYFCKGEYFAVSNGKNKMLNSLIYPLPNKNISLGVHATLDVNGGLKLGPNAFFIEKKDKNYKVNNVHLADFFNSAVKFLPFLEKKDLHPDQAGIRPKISLNANKFYDFIIRNEYLNGCKNFINLLGIESPGLTASLAIADYVNSLIR